MTGQILCPSMIMERIRPLLLPSRHWLPQKSKTKPQQQRMSDPVTFVLVVLSVPTLFVLWFAICVHDWSTLCKKCCRQQHNSQQPPPQPQEFTTEQVRPGHSNIPHDIEHLDNSKSLIFRPYVGYVLQSIIDSREHAENEEEVSTELPTTITLQDNDAEFSRVRIIHLSVDFGDFEILPLEELSCPICLLEYEHGDVVQRSVCHGSNCNYSTRNHQNTTNLTVDINQCDHIFHRKCITKWIQTNIKNECPICRRVFRDGDAWTNGISQVKT